MTFLAREQSNYHGQPILLYEFRRGDVTAYYASADQDITANGVVFKSAPMSNVGTKQKGDAVTDVYEIQAPDFVAPAIWYAYTPPSSIVYVVVRRFHYGDSFAAIVWIGTIVSVTSEKPGTVKINCHAISVSLKRGGLRLAWQRGCPHALYDRNCKADPEAFVFSTTLAATTPVNLVLAGALPNGPHWPGGYVEWNITGETQERRLIEAVIPAYGIVPYGNMDGFLPGSPIRVYPGCFRTSVWCESFFDNLDNYGGFEYMPTRTPFDGDPVF